MKSMVLLVVAVGCGLVAMVGVQQVLSNGEAQAKEDETMSVLVAVVEVPAGTALNETNVEFRDMPTAVVPPGAVTTPDEYVERAPKAALFPGEVVLVGKLGDKGDYRASEDIPVGMRVVTVSVNLTKTHSGLIQPGDFVDLQVTYQSRSQTAGLIKKTKTFLQNIEVFATDSLRSSEKGGSEDIKAKNISLLVSPSDANLLKLCESAGELHLVLRGQSDTEATEVDDFSLADIDDIGGSVDRRDEPTAEPTDAKGGDLQNFLTDVDPDNEPTPEPAVLASVEPTIVEPEVIPPEIWAIEIHAGEEVRIEEIEIPREEETADVTGGAIGLLKQFLGSTAKVRDNASVTPSPAAAGSFAAPADGSDNADTTDRADTGSAPELKAPEATPDPVDSAVLDAVKDLLNTDDPAKDIERQLQPLTAG